jgi:hypothetical protein
MYYPRAMRQGGILCFCREMLPLSEKVTAIPMGLL